MEAYARAPDPLNLSDDMANAWRVWKVEFLAFINVAGFNDHPTEEKASLLKNRIGKVGLDVIEVMTFEQPHDKDDMDILLEKLDAYFDPPKKEIIERNRFFSRSKRNNETVEEYVSNLQKLARDCNFEHLTDSIIRDKVILEIKDYELRKKIFNEDYVNLPTLISICNNYEVTTRKWRQGPTENVYESENIGRTKKPYINKGKTCWRCGVSHPLNNCPAWGKQCANCNAYNHFTACCQMGENRGNDRNKDKRNEINQTTNTPNSFTNAKKNMKSNNTPEKATNITTGCTTNRMNTTNPVNFASNSTLPKVPIMNLPLEHTPSTSSQPLPKPRPMYAPKTVYNSSADRQFQQKSKESECVLS